MIVTTRFAPSPTGYFHAGSYRTALFSWIFAQQNKGKFILRIEDTDKERSKYEYEENIVESLKWLGLEYDQFYRQSDRTEVYKRYLKKLIESGHAYISDETEVNTNSKSDQPRRSSVIRFRNPNKKIVFDDIIRGRIEFDTTELGDFVIAKSEHEPVFHLVVVIDDHEMGITHIIRGEDHISNTPRQILIFEAIGAQVPYYAHIPLLLSPDKSKLSKRKGAIPVSEYRSKGYVREAIVNYLALLGWHPADDNREVLTIDEIITQFSLDRVQKAGAVFDEEKLRWFNRQYILKMSDNDFVDYAKIFLPEWIVPNSIIFNKLIPVLRNKITTFGEIPEILSGNGELAFINKLSDYKTESLLWKKNPDAKMAVQHLSKVIDLLSVLPDTSTTESASEFTAENIKSVLWSYIESSGKGDVLWPLRMAVTGQDKSPDPFISTALLGKDEALRRISLAIKKLI